MYEGAAREEANTPIDTNGTAIECRDAQREALRGELLLGEIEPRLDEGRPEALACQRGMQAEPDLDTVGVRLELKEPDEPVLLSDDRVVASRPALRIQDLREVVWVILSIIEAIRLFVMPPADSQRLARGE